ncbi:hypothetical protein P8452_43958 [Trifolium repens]|nr:hypothetical protein P8452_43958 [Trifolium repens]
MKSPAVSNLHGFEFKPKPFCFSQNKSQMVFQIFFLYMNSFSNVEDFHFNHSLIQAIGDIFSNQGYFKSPPSWVNLTTKTPRCVQQMFVGRKSLFVEERKTQLQAAHFAEIVAPGGLAPPAARIHAYYPEASRLASQQAETRSKMAKKGAQRNGNLQHVPQEPIAAEKNSDAMCSCGCANLQCFNKGIGKVKDSKLADRVKISPLELLLNALGFSFIVPIYY